MISRVKKAGGYPHFGARLFLARRPWVWPTLASLLSNHGVPQVLRYWTASSGETRIQSEQYRLREVGLTLVDDGN